MKKKNFFCLLLAGLLLLTPSNRLEAYFLPDPTAVFTFVAVAGAIGGGVVVGAIIGIGVGIGALVNHCQGKNSSSPNNKKQTQPSRNKRRHMRHQHSKTTTSTKAHVHEKNHLQEKKN